MIDKNTGWISSYQIEDEELLQMPLQPNFWRAPIDNDFGNNMPKRCGVWKNLEKSFEIEHMDVSHPIPGKVIVNIHYSITKIKSDAQIQYHIYSNGAIEVNSTFDLKKDDLPEIPRIGFRTRLKSDYNEFAYFGKGPHENYIDRNTAAFVDLYHSKASEQYYPYIRPQENGYKTEVRWASLKNKQGKGLKVSGTPYFCTSAMPYAQEDFDPGKEKAQRHAVDIEKRDFVEWHIDLKQMGLGGDNSWGRRPHNKYMIYPDVYSFSFTLEPNM